MSIQILRSPPLNALVANSRGGRETPLSQPIMWRLGLIGSCLAATLTAWLAGDPTAYLQADPDLALVLRGMALIKAALVVAAMIVVLWRYAWPLPARLSTAYLLGVTMMTFSSMTIWQLSHLVGASVLFHLGIFLLLGSAYLDNAGLAVIARRGSDLEAK